MDLNGAAPDWPHAPVHRLRDAGTYIITAGTYQGTHHFQNAERLTYLTKSLLALADKYGWELQAWAVFSNHYHFVAESSQPATLRRLVQHLHSLPRNTSIIWIALPADPSGSSIGRLCLPIRSHIWRA